MCSATSAGTDGSTMRLWMASCMWAAHCPLLPCSQRGARQTSSGSSEHNLSGRRCGQGEILVPQIRRDAAEEERPACAEYEACVDVGGIGDDTLVEHVGDLVGHRPEDVARDLVDRARPVL